MGFRPKFSICLFVLLLLLPLGAFAQTESTGSITGVIYDSTGAVMPGARVIVTNSATHFTWSAEASSVGEYKVSFLPVGAYEVVAEAQGFRIGCWMPSKRHQYPMRSPQFGTALLLDAQGGRITLCRC